MRYKLVLSAKQDIADLSRLKDAARYTTSSEQLTSIEVVRYFINDKEASTILSSNNLFGSIPASVSKAA